MEEKKVPKRIANTIMNALQGGVVPRTGLGYIAVGRNQEISALLKDLEIIEEGGATFRFITGNYGSGKTFLLQTIKEHAINRGYVVADADLSPERSLVGSNIDKRGLSTFSELMSNISTKTSPTGGALGKILNNWMESIWQDVAMSMSGRASAGDMASEVESRIYNTILSMQALHNGFDFADVLILYWKAQRACDKETESKALKWLRGEYRLKRDAQRELGVSSIINDNDWFDYIKLYSEFFAKIGYKGFIIMIDEMINLYRYSFAATRQKNYERILNMYNDALQEKAHYLGILMGGTPKSVEDTDRGVFSYEALRSRLSPGRFKDLNVVNLMTPIIRIQPLNKSEIAVLLEKIGKIHAEVHGYTYQISIEEIVDYIETVYNSMDVMVITPRSIIRDFVNLLNILCQNSEKTISDLMREYTYTTDIEDDTDFSESE